MEFDFNLVGTIDDPKFDPGPIIQQVLSNALRDKMSGQSIGEHLGIEEKLKDIDTEEIEGAIGGIQKELEKIIDY